MIALLQNGIVLTRQSGISHIDLDLAGPTRGFRHALGRNRNLSILHGLDAVDGTFSRTSPDSDHILISLQPFVDPGHPLHDLFPPRVWAIRIPVILALLGSAVVGTFIAIVMINSNKKKAAKAKAAAKKKT